MFKISQKLLTTTILGGALALAGCTTNPSINTAPEVETQIVEIPAFIHVPSLGEAPHGEDPVELMEFGLALAKAGKHGDAGNWFMEVAGISSREERWAVACATEAAYQFLLADDLPGFQKAIETINNSQGKWTRLAPGQMTETMLAIAEVAKGNTVNLDFPKVFSALVKE